MTEAAKTLIQAYDKYQVLAPPHYDEVLLEVAARAAAAGCLGKADVGALVAWKCLNASTPWMRKFMMTSDLLVRETTAKMMMAANDVVEVEEAARNARSALSTLPGFKNGNAVA